MRSCWLQPAPQPLLTAFELRRLLLSLLPLLLLQEHLPILLVLFHLVVVLAIAVHHDVLLYRLALVLDLEMLCLLHFFFGSRWLLAAQLQFLGQLGVGVRVFMPCLLIHAFVFWQGWVLGCLI